MTLTKYWVKGARNISSHGILERFEKTTPEAREAFGKLYQTYYPMEISHTLSFSEKVKAMEEWWTKSHEIILQLNLNHQDINKMVDQTPLVFRDGLQNLIDMCQLKQIPLLIFSAGIANIIHQVLEKSGFWKPNMHIVSNQLSFNASGIVDHFKGNLIHVFNKNESSVTDEKYKSLIQHRKNVILLGDSIGDLRMADGIPHDTKLTIGFLNHDQDKLQEAYMNAFDIIILNDTSLDFITHLLHCIE